MNSVRGLSPLTVCLCVQLSVCLLGVCDSSSLWGQKIQFGPVSCLWQLHSDTVVPALKELTVCALLRLEVGSQWTGFVYKAPGGRDIELGLQGTAGDIAVQLFGKDYPYKSNLTLNEWYSICLAWSGHAQRLQVYINGVFQFSLNESQPQELTPGGTLTLGVSHFVQSGEVKAETGTNLIGQISLFRMWAREWTAEELSKQSCADGDVLSWDTKQWSYKCNLVPDSDLQCAWPLYKINMMISVTSSRPENCSVSPEELTRDWLKSILSGNISVHDISVSSSSSACDWVNNAAAQPTQESGDPSNSSCSMCFSCEVYVNVDPATDVQAIQVNISTSLSSAFPHGFFILESDPQSISIQPVESFPAVTVPPPTISPGAATVTFFRVNVNLSMTGSPREPQEIIKTWVKERLEVNNTMIVRNVIIREAVNKYCCNFHVQEYNMKSAAEISANINAALTPNYENGSITIEDVNVVVKHIVPENCSEDSISTVFGSYFWPETLPEVNQRRTCRSPNSKAAYRLCKLHIETDTTSWEDPDMRNCDWDVSIPGLSNVTITDGNADEVVNVIENLVYDRLNNSSELSSSELDTVLEKLLEVIHNSIIKPAIVDMIINIFADILLSKTDMTQVSNTVLGLTEQMGNNLEFQIESVSVTAPSLALSMVNVNPNEFNGLSFGVSSVNATLNPKPAAPNMGASNIHMPAADTRLALQLILQTGKLSSIFLKQSSVDEPLPDTDATISLPLALQHFLRSTERNTTRVQFQFYGTQKLFQDSLPVSATERNWTVHPFIISASINDSHVTNLEDPVLVTFRHPAPKHSEDKIKCVFWDFQKNGGLGGWNSSGCETKIISSSCTSCFCDHLTHFAVLLDVTRDPISATDSQILAVLSYIGCGISSIFLGITLLTYIAFEKLRRDYPSKILINLSAALLGLSMLFLLNSWLSSFSNYCLCIATAATMHYFLLASFTWMGLEAVHMYLALVKVFNIYIPSYILKFCAIGWGLPLAIVSLVLVIDKDAYGSTLPEKAAVALESDDPFCWLQNAVFFYVTVAAFLFLILLCNICVFIVVLIQIRQMRINKPSANSRGSLHDLRAAAGLTVLLGLTWAVGFFSFGPGRVVFMYLFTIFNTLQGFFVFMFHCLIKENVRKQWRTHLCCGRFRLSDYSDWSRTLTMGIRRKKNNLVNSDSVGSDSSATIRKESNSSTGSAPNYHQRA